MPDSGITYKSQIYLIYPTLFAPARVAKGFAEMKLNWRRLGSVCRRQLRPKAILIPQPSPICVQAKLHMPRVSEKARKREREREIGGTGGMWQVRADGHLSCALITFGARLAASEIAFSNLLDMRFRFTLFPFPLAVSVHTHSKWNRYERRERERERWKESFCCYRNLCVSDFHGLTRDLGKGNAEDREADGDREREGDRQLDAEVEAEVEAAKWKWKRSQIQAPPAAAM